MILDESQIVKIITTNPNRKLIERGRLLNLELRRNIYGTTATSHLEIVDGYEKASTFEIRKKFAKSNKDMISRLLRPIDKVFTAKGGSQYLQLSPEQENLARQMIMDMKGENIFQYMQNVWRAHYIDDPYGVIFMEVVPEAYKKTMMQRGSSMVYPTYKAITYIYDYLPAGSRLEYICFELDATDKKEANLDEKHSIYRLIDDAFDYYIKRDGENVEILNGYTIPNSFGYVPAIRFSDIPDPECAGGVLSILSDVTENLKLFYRKGSMKLTYEFLFAFPKYWEYADTCSMCKGTKEVDGKDCPQCNATGKQTISQPSDRKVLNHPEDKDTPLIAPNVAGFVTPPKDFYDISKDDLATLEDISYFTIWGATPQSRTNGPNPSNTSSPADPTATQIVIESAPKQDRLAPISACAEKAHKFMIDCIIRYTFNSNYPGCSINYGRRFLTESPDVLWDKYSKARASGAPISVLDDMLNKYYESEYASDPVKLSIQQKLMRIEPFVHYSVDKVKSLGTDENDYKKKLFFSEWLSSTTQAQLMIADANTLMTSLDTYISSRAIPKPVPELPA